MYSFSPLPIAPESLNKQSQRSHIHMDTLFHMKPTMLASPSSPPYDHPQHHAHQDQGPTSLLFHQPIQKTQTATHTSAFHRPHHSPMSCMPSPPELLHDMEDEEDSTSLMSVSSRGSSDSVCHALPIAKRSRKSTPHRSPMAIKDPLQASALDKSVVFQLDVRSHPFFPASSKIGHQEMDSNHQASPSGQAEICPDCRMRDCCGLACTSRIICGESVLAALRKRVNQARHRTKEESPSHRRRMVLHSPKRQIRKPVHIEIPTARSRIRHSRTPCSYKDGDDAVIATTTTTTTTTTLATAADTAADAVTAYHSQDHQAHLTPSPSTASSQERHINPIHRRPWLDDVAPANQSLPQASPSATLPETVAQPPVPVPRNPTTHHTSGRPSRVKGPCQACQESSDGCMRKAFDWPFPTSSIYNDKGRPFVYLCNKCGLRYNKSGGCVCRHCRWVFCKEEKRKAMQLIEQMRRSRPDGHVDPDEDIENFVCTPKYWACGRPWKVGWVLQDNSHQDEDEDSAMTD